MKNLKTLLLVCFTLFCNSAICGNLLLQIPKNIGQVKTAFLTFNKENIKAVYGSQAQDALQAFEKITLITKNNTIDMNFDSNNYIKTLKITSDYMQIIDLKVPLCLNIKILNDLNEEKLIKVMYDQFYGNDLIISNVSCDCSDWNVSYFFQREDISRPVVSVTPNPSRKNSDGRSQYSVYD